MNSYMMTSIHEEGLTIFEVQGSKLFKSSLSSCIQVIIPFPILPLHLSHLKALSTL